MNEYKTMDRSVAAFLLMKGLWCDRIDDNPQDPSRLLFVFGEAEDARVETENYFKCERVVAKYYAWGMRKANRLIRDKRRGESEGEMK